MRNTLLASVAAFALCTGTAYATPLVDSHDTNQTAVQTQGQNQNQGQAQGQVSTNVNTNAVVGVNSNKNHNNNYNSNSNKNNNSNRNTNNNQSNASSDQSQGQSVSISNPRDPVSTAVATQLVATEDTCMGSSSVGAQGVGFGVSIGTSWTDDNCKRLKNSGRLQALGYKDAATQLMCIDEEVRGAMKQAGTPCPDERVQEAVLPQEERPQATMSPIPNPN